MGIVGVIVGIACVGYGFVRVGAGGTGVEEGAHETTIPTKIKANARKKY